MFNPVDTRQVRSLIDYRREQLAADAYRVQKSVQSHRSGARRWNQIRFAVGTRLIRVGAWIAGMYAHDLPHLRPGV